MIDIYLQAECKTVDPVLKTLWILISWLSSCFENTVDPDQLASEKPADLDSQCFQNGIYLGSAWEGLNYTKKLTSHITLSTNFGYTVLSHSTDLALACSIP